MKIKESYDILLSWLRKKDLIKEESDEFLLTKIELSEEVWFPQSQGFEGIITIEVFNKKGEVVKK